MEYAGIIETVLDAVRDLGKLANGESLIDMGFTEDEIRAALMAGEIRNVGSYYEVMDDNA